MMRQQTTPHLFYPSAIAGSFPSLWKELESNILGPISIKFFHSSEPGWRVAAVTPLKSLEKQHIFFCQPFLVFILRHAKSFGCPGRTQTYNPPALASQGAENTSLCQDAQLSSSIFEDPFYPLRLMTQQLWIWGKALCSDAPSKWM